MYFAQTVRIRDGDSLVVMCNGSYPEIRLYGIDAPEHGQPGFQEARSALMRMLGRMQFRVEPQHQDPYGRTVALLYHANTHRHNSVNLQMVREGYAYAYTRYGGEELGFHQAEADARQGRRGIWQQSPQGGERPWDYRGRHRKRDRVQGKVTDGCFKITLMMTLVITAIAMLAILGAGG